MVSAADIGQRLRQRRNWDRRLRETVLVPPTAAVGIVSPLQAQAPPSHPLPQHL
jgi:hypothetical protein